MYTIQMVSTAHCSLKVVSLGQLPAQGEQAAHSFQGLAHRSTMGHVLSMTSNSLCSFSRNGGNIFPWSPVSGCNNVQQHPLLISLTPTTLLQVISLFLQLSYLNRLLYSSRNLLYDRATQDGCCLLAVHPLFGWPLPYPYPTHMTDLPP